MTVREVIDTHPQPTMLDHEALVRCITECLDCAASCTSCVDACLAEADVVELVRCIRLCLDCGDICGTTADALLRQTAPDLDVLRAATRLGATACRACRAECERHASHHEHCRLCAEACRRCEDACGALLGAMR